MWFILSTPVLIKHLWQLETVFFLHLCLKAVFYCVASLKVVKASKEGKPISLALSRLTSPMETRPKKFYSIDPKTQRAVQL